MKKINLKFFIIFYNLFLIINQVNLSNLNKNNDDSSSKKHIKFINSFYKKEFDSNYWIENARRHLLQKLLKQPNFRKAKNVILFLGDGMSISTITASRIHKGQKQGKYGEDSNLFFETFPFTGLVKTYCVNKQVADSACSATAYLCGVKANYATIGVKPNVSFNDCKASMNETNHLESLALLAQKAGKGTGIITTTRVTHASPAGNYAYVANRAYECDSDVNKRYKKLTYCQDIASQLILNRPGKYFNVIMGGGRKKFLPQTMIDENGESGQRLDNIDLIEVWKDHKKSLNSRYEYVYDRKTMKSIDFMETDYILGLFNSNHMKFHSNSNENYGNGNGNGNDDDYDMNGYSKTINKQNLNEIKNMNEPSLAEMTEAAIKTLKKHKNGFYLFVEGGKIDHAHHGNNAFKAIDETIEFDKAVEIATKLTSTDDTLIIVTADHSHVMTISGYPNRGQNIFGYNQIDNIVYPTLSYANGPGYKTSNNVKLNKNTKYPAMINLESETHGGDDVSIYANGPWSHLFTGVIEQNLIPHLISFASCMGDGPSVCKNHYYDNSFIFNRIKTNTN